MKIPNTMRAIAIDRFGGPEVLVIHELPVPRIAPQEVLIASDTAGVGIWDAKARDGAWAESDRFPLILGADGSGVIAAIGSNVKRLSIGDRVYACSYNNPKGGFYAEYVAVAASKVAPIPDGLDMVRAGALPTIALTALQGVDDALGIEEGESIIVHGASGNVGMLAVQFAKRKGARVLATASGKDGMKFVRRLGVDEAIDGKADDIKAAANEFAPDGINAVLAFIGGKELTRCLDALRKGGRLAYPFLGPYHASKFAIEGISASLRRELLLFGIDVIVVAPGSVATAIWSKAEAEDFTPYANTPYGPALRRLREAMLKLGRKGLKPEVLGAGIHRALTDARPKARYTITPDPVQDFLASHLPARWVDSLMASQLGLRAGAF